jgi:hypothetical protein
MQMRNVNSSLLLGYRLFRSLFHVQDEKNVHGIDSGPLHNKLVHSAIKCPPHISSYNIPGINYSKYPISITILVTGEVLENRVLRRIFVPMKVVVTGRWR